MTEQNIKDVRRKTYVEVIVQHKKEGTKIPLSIKFADGRSYSIDKVNSVQRAAASKAGGTGIRYTITVGTKQTFIFEDEDKWFVEEKVKHQ